LGAPVFDMFGPALLCLLITVSGRSRRRRRAWGLTARTPWLAWSEFDAMQVRFLVPPNPSQGGTPAAARQKMTAW